ncbi:NAD(P)-dependent oxidoreductase [Methylomicrobium sp. Wu6]|uniref:NAD-dependent epimerase/dehydratase family protein n=1 Tax=Methylomicrobium sp. Wu6 TaxID=3107928 RepID=UPI002DD68248|nr:NAD(P)-dependent oxidoreductase [Methylomicrobium sp. Wu6]MEC4749582.1 NAD(P)-dependent oxidoreductase [Methylomicrobium sp. Wu6]
MNGNAFIINFSDPILITGASGFIGSKVVENLIDHGFTNLRCLVRPSSNLASLKKIIENNEHAKIQIIKGNLQSRTDCAICAEGVSVIYHLAAGRGEKSYADAFMNSVVTTRNLLDTISGSPQFKRFVNISSFAVYSNQKISPGGLLDESCAIEDEPHKTGEAYCYAKVRQDELVMDYGEKYNIPYVIARPAVVYGPGSKGISGRVGIGTFGIFLHLGGQNRIPLTYVDNCAEAIVLAGIVDGVDGEVFNIIDDNPPTSRELLKAYKQKVGWFPSIYLPHFLSHLLSFVWEKYSEWSERQLPPTFNCKRWENYWKGNTYSNKKIKQRLNWKVRIDANEAISRYFEYQNQVGENK